MLVLCPCDNHKSNRYIKLERNDSFKSDVIFSFRIKAEIDEPIWITVFENEIRFFYLLDCCLHIVVSQVFYSSINSIFYCYNHTVDIF